MNHVGVIGEGKMGAGIFQMLLNTPSRLTWLCSPEADAGKIHNQTLKRVRRSLEAGLLDKSLPDREETIAVSTDPGTLADCDLILEAIPEDAVLKREMFRHLDRIVKREALFATNSSSILPSDISPEGRADRFAGLHFFYPVSLVNVAEIIRSPATSGESMDLLKGYLTRAGRRYIELDEINAFILNKIFLEVQNEAFRLVVEGKSDYAAIDRIVRNRMFTFGVFDFCDSVGIRTMAQAIRNYTERYPHPEHYAAFLETLDRLVAEGRTGRQAGHGFHDYPLPADEPPLPADAGEIEDYLLQSWYSACRRFTARSGLTIEEANHAIREYFGVARGPFERTGG